MICVRVYVSPDGRRPFNIWFQGLDQAAGFKIARAINQMEHGNFSDSRSVGEGVMERRIHSGPDIESTMAGLSGLWFCYWVAASSGASRLTYGAPW